MRLLRAYVGALALVAACGLTGAAAQGPKAELPPPKTSTPKPKPKPAPPRNSTPERVRTPTPKPPATATLVIISSQPNATVLIGGRQYATDAGGLLRLERVAPGQYDIVVSKPKHTGDVRRVYVAAGANQTERFSLAPLPARLSVETDVEGARVRVSNVGEFASVENLEVAPGRYQVTASRPGYRAAADDVTLGPAEERRIRLVLEPVPTEELLAEADAHYSASRMREAYETAALVLERLPAEPRAHWLAGASLYSVGQFPASVGHLARAIEGGRAVTLTVKHNHPRAGRAPAFLCTGQLTLRRDGVEFHARGDSSHDFNVPASKLYELRHEPASAGRVQVRVGVPKGRKEEKLRYDFHPASAEYYAAGAANVSCQNCVEQSTAIYQLVAYVRRPSAVSSAPAPAARPSSSVVMPAVALAHTFTARDGSFRIGYPADWNVATETDATATVVAPGGRDGEEIKRGVIVGHLDLTARPSDRATLERALDAVVRSVRQNNSYLAEARGRQVVSAGGREGLSALLAGRTPSGYDERVWVVVVPGGRGVVYAFFIAPAGEVRRYEPTYRRMLDSLVTNNQ